MDLNGEAKVITAKTASVTARVHYPASNIRVVYNTVLGVRPGENIAIGLPRTTRGTYGETSTRTATLAVPDGSVNHHVYTSCDDFFISDTNTAVTLTQHTDCASPSYDVLAIKNTSRPRYVYLANQPLGVTTDLSIPDTWRDMADLRVQHVNLPDDVTTINTRRATRLGYAFGDQSRAEGGRGTTINHTLLYPSALALPAWFEASMSTASGDGQRWTMGIKDPAASVAFDWNAMRLPRIFSPTATPTSVTWTETALTHEADARMITWNATFTSPDVPAMTWNIYDSDRGTTLTLPELPPSHAAYDPRKLPGFAQSELRVRYIDCDVVTTPKQARELNAKLFQDNTRYGEWLGDNYRCRMSAGGRAAPPPPPVP